MKNYTKIPNEILESSQLSISERYLYCVLLRYCGKKDNCFPGQERLAKDLGRSTKQVRNLLARLIKIGVIFKIRRGWNRSNTYEVAKSLNTDRKSITPLIGSTFPLHTSNTLPDKNTYLTGKDKKSRIGFEKIRQIVNSRCRTLPIINN